MLHQKRKKALRDEMIRQQEESPGAWQKVRYQHQKSARNIGFALILTFVLVPVLFVLLYVRADNIYNEDLPGNDPGSNLDVLGDYDDYPDNRPGQTSGTDPAESSAPEEPNEPNEPNEQNGQNEPAEQFTGTAYLTFDDGPHKTISPAILDILLDEEIKATFFMLPYTGADDIFQRVIDEGHEIGNHSFSHDYDKLYKGSLGAFREDVIKARRFVEERFAYSSTSFRFPGGAMNQTREIRNPRIDAINELDYRHFDWDIDTDDWRRGTTPEDIVKTIMENTNKKEHVIILMHDTYERTLQALPEVISGLKSQGYTFDVLRNHP